MKERVLTTSNRTGINVGIDWDREYENVQKYINQGLSFAAIGKLYGVHRKTVQGVVSRRAPGGSFRSIKRDPLHMRLQVENYDWPEKVGWREHFDAFQKALDLCERSDPFVEHFTIRVDTDKPIGIVSASDLHLGGGFTDHQAIRDTFEYILRTDGLYVALTGDTIEGFIAGVKPAETIEQQISPVKQQLWAAESLVEELVEADKLLWLGWGDHDAKWFEQTIGINIVREMFKHDVPYLMGRAIIRLAVGSEEYFILANHAERGRSRNTATAAGRQAYESFFPADVVISGHTHKPEFRRFDHYAELRAAGLNLGGKSWIVQNGTFKTGPDPYTIRTWNRGVLGVPTMVFQPGCHDVDVFDTPKKAMQFIKGGEVDGE